MPYENPWKRKKPFDLFDDFEREFREIEEQMGRFFEEIRKRGLKDFEKGPHIYGFSMRLGPDGKPKFEEFGNISQKTFGEKFTSEREPLTDVIEAEKEIKVIAELPGIEKKDIELSARDHSLEIKVDAPDRKYHKEVSLPAEVKPDTTRASYKNGVLEVRLTRSEEKKKNTGFSVNIE